MTLLTIFFCITAGAIKSVLFVAEEDDADGPFGTDTKIQNDLGGRHGDSDASAVVDCPSSQIPGIQMSADGDDVVWFFLPADLAIDVVGGQVSGRNILQIDRQPQGGELPR